MKFPIALQMYSVRDKMDKDLFDAFKAVKELGYDGVELCGLYGHTPVEVRDMLSTLGLEVMSAHVAYAEMIVDPEKTMSDYSTIGCRYIVIPWLEADLRPGGARFDETQKEIEILGKAAGKYGMTLLYHNHNFEFAKVDGEYALDMLYRVVPSQLLQPQIDTAWVKFAGVDPAEFLRKYAGRAKIVHFKDFFCTGEQSGMPFELIGDKKSAGSTASPSLSTFQFRPVGYGVQDVKSLVAACEDIGAEWIIVEQDFPHERDSLEAARMSLEYLKSL